MALCDAVGDSLLFHGLSASRVPPEVGWEPQEDLILLDMEGCRGEFFFNSLTKACIHRSSAFVLPSVPGRRHYLLRTSLPPLPCNTKVTRESWEMVPELEFDILLS